MAATFQPLGAMFQCPHSRSDVEQQKQRDQDKQPNGTGSDQQITVGDQAQKNAVCGDNCFSHNIRIRNPGFHQR